MRNGDWLTDLMIDIIDGPNPRRTLQQAQSGLIVASRYNDQSRQLVDNIDRRLTEMETIDLKEKAEKKKRINKIKELQDKTLTSLVGYVYGLVEDVSIVRDNKNK